MGMESLREKKEEKKEVQEERGRKNGEGEEYVMEDGGGARGGKN